MTSPAHDLPTTCISSPGETTSASSVNSVVFKSHQGGGTPRAESTLMGECASFDASLASNFYITAYSRLREKNVPVGVHISLGYASVIRACFAWIRQPTLFLSFSSGDSGSHSIYLGVSSSDSNSSGARRTRLTAVMLRICKHSEKSGLSSVLHITHKTRTGFPLHCRCFDHPNPLIDADKCRGRKLCTLSRLPSIKLNAFETRYSKCQVLSKLTMCDFFADQCILDTLRWEDTGSFSAPFS